MNPRFIIFAVFLTAVLGLSACSGDGRSNGVVNASNSNIETSSAPSQAGLATVKITSPDGVVLVGSMWPAEKPNSPALLLLHQWASDRHSYDEFAKRMHARGFAVLSIDGRGFGESTKSTDGKTVSPERTDAAVRAMLGDVSAAYDFLGKQQNVDQAKIGIVGASYGSSLAIIYATDNTKVTAVALLSPGLNYFGNMQIEPAVKKYGPTRAVFLAAADDDPESADAVNKLVGQMAHDSKLSNVTSRSGGHGTALFTVGLGDPLEKFLIENLAK